MGFQLVFLAAGSGIGLIVGSFLASVCYRLPLNQPLVWSRSRCDRCQSTLAAHELVPVLSYLAFKGRCRRCRSPIDPRHLTIELAAGAVGATATMQASPILGAATALFGWILIVLAVLDLTHLWLPDGITFPLLMAGIIVSFALGFETGLASLIGAVAGFASLQTVAFAYKRFRGIEGLGGGDPKLFAAIGAWVGWASLPFVLLGAALLGLAYAGILHLAGRSVKREVQLPFGTMLAVAAWPAWLILVAR